MRRPFFYSAFLANFYRPFQSHYPFYWFTHFFFVLIFFQNISVGTSWSDFCPLISAYWLTQFDLSCSKSAQIGEDSFLSLHSSSHNLPLACAPRLEHAEWINQKWNNNYNIRGFFFRIVYICDCFPGLPPWPYFNSIKIPKWSSCFCNCWPFIWSVVVKIFMFTWNGRLYLCLVSEAWNMCF